MVTEKKYKLTDEFITIGDKKLYRIEALKDFSDVKEGDKGGFVESEANLSQYDDCWIYNDAKVFDDACISDDARVFGKAMVYGEAEVFDYAWLYDNAKVYGDAKIYGYSRIFDSAMVGGKAKVFENAKIFRNAEVYDDANIFGNALVYGNAKVFGNANVYGDTIVCRNSKVFGDALIFGNAKIEDANIANNFDYIVFKNWWSSARYFTWTRSNNMWSVGCFFGTGEELIAKAYKDSELSGKEYERVVKYVESILKDSKII